MKLYTVEITFADFTRGIEQYEADSPEQAVQRFFEEAACLQNYDRKELLGLLKKKVDDKSVLLHAADMRGVWLIIFGTESDDSTQDPPAIYGGLLTQADPHGPRRS